MNKKVNEKRLEARVSGSETRSRHAIEKRSESEETSEYTNKRQRIDETDQGIY
jgi:hypothetical protein